jgi:hypothetical protein
MPLQGLRYPALLPSAAPKLMPSVRRMSGYTQQRCSRTLHPCRACACTPAAEGLQQEVARPHQHRAPLASQTICSQHFQKHIGSISGWIGEHLQSSTFLALSQTHLCCTRTVICCQNRKSRLL